MFHVNRGGRCPRKRGSLTQVPKVWPRDNDCAPEFILCHSFFFEKSSPITMFLWLDLNLNEKPWGHGNHPLWPSWGHRYPVTKAILLASSKHSPLTSVVLLNFSLSKSYRLYELFHWVLGVRKYWNSYLKILWMFQRLFYTNTFAKHIIYLVLKALPYYFWRIISFLRF